MTARLLNLTKAKHKAGLLSNQQSLILNVCEFNSTQWKGHTFRMATLRLFVLKTRMDKGGGVGFYCYRRNEANDTILIVISTFSSFI